MEDDGHGKDAYHCERAAVAEVALAIEIAHGTCHREMGRHSRQSAHDACNHPVLALEKIEDVLGTRKSQTDTRRIDDAIKILVIIRILAQEKP